MNGQVLSSSSILDCKSPIDILLRLESGVGKDDAFVDCDVLTLTADWHGPRFEWPPLFNTVTHGPVAEVFPEHVFAFASVASSHDVPELTALRTLNGAFIVGRRMKSVIDSFAIPNSEIFPVKMVLRRCDVKYSPPGSDVEAMGGGEIIEKGYWLWHVLNRCDLVDWSNSEQQPYLVDKVRFDLPGTPVQRISLVGNSQKLALHQPNYDENAVFDILGCKAVFASPEFVRRMATAGIIYSEGSERYASARVRPYYLDEPRQITCKAEQRQGSIKDMPPLRIAGTSVIVENRPSGLSLSTLGKVGIY